MSIRAAPRPWKVAGRSRRALAAKAADRFDALLGSSAKKNGCFFFKNHYHTLKQ
jgi:hypothetical protein